MPTVTKQGLKQAWKWRLKAEMTEEKIKDAEEFMK